MFLYSSLLVRCRFQCLFLIALSILVYVPSMVLYISTVIVQVTKPYTRTVSTAALKTFIFWFSLRFDFHIIFRLFRADHACLRDSNMYIMFCRYYITSKVFEIIYFLIFSPFKLLIIVFVFSFLLNLMYSVFLAFMFRPISFAFSSIKSNRVFSSDWSFVVRAISSV